MPTPNPANPPFRPPPVLIGIGVLMVAVGFALPRLAPEPTSPAVPAASTLTRSPDTALPTTVEGPGLGAAVGRLAVCLAVVCAAVVGVTRLVQKPATETAGGMQVLAAHAIDVRCAVYLVRAGDRRLLIGTDHTGVKALVELPPGVPTIPQPPVPPEPAERPTVDEITTLFARIRTT